MRNRILARACAGALAATALFAGADSPLDLGAHERADAASSAYEPHWLGARELRLGDRGFDVKTLNWALRSESLGTPHHASFVPQTDSAVRSLQRNAGLPADGIVRRQTRKLVAAGMRNQRATWYGPGLYGNRTACGRKLTKRTIGVAHRKLPCGTRVAFAHKGRWVHAKVIDRGPFRKGYKWDLTYKLAKQLGVIKKGTATVKTGVAR